MIIVMNEFGGTPRSVGPELTGRILTRREFF
jgi:hypothetical protein